MRHTRSPWAMPLSLLAALLLGLLPLTDALQPVRPYWLALVAAYWILEDPDRFGLGMAFVTGLVADLVLGSLMGEQALRLVVVTFILQRFRARLRFFPMSQQALFIGGLLLNDRIVMAAVHMALGDPAPPSTAWLGPVVGMVLWPLVFLLLDSVRLGSWRRR